MDAETRRIVDSTMIGEAVESLPIAVFVSDATLNFLAVNSAAAALVGVPREELLARRVPDVVDGPPPRLREAARRAEEQELVTGESTLRRADGASIEVVYATMAARIGRLPVLISFVRPKRDADAEQVLGLLGELTGSS